MSRTRTRPVREGVDLALGERIRRARTTRGRSQHALAAQVAVRPMTICDAELGQSSPSADLVAHIAKALDVDPGWLLTGEGPEPESPATAPPPAAA